MEDRTLRVLEFTKIRDMLCGLAVSEMGAAVCAALTPLDELEAVRIAQEETEEALVLLTYLPQHPLVAFEDVRPSLKLAAIGRRCPRAPCWMWPPACAPPARPAKRW